MLFGLMRFSESLFCFSMPESTLHFQWIRKGFTQSILRFWNFLAMWNQSKIGSIVWQWGSRTEMTDQQLLHHLKAVTRVCWLSPCLSAAWWYVLMVFRSSSAETTQLLSVIWWWCWSTNSRLSIDYSRQSFKTPFASIFGRNIPPSTCTINSSAGTDSLWVRRFLILIR